MVLAPKETNKISFIEKYQKYIFLIALLILAITFYSVYFNNTYPITEGWGIYYTELLKAGKIPYKDFYYYLPPLNLIIDNIFWQFSFGYLIIYRLFRLIERLCMLALIYLLLSRFFKYKYAFVATLLSSILAVSDVYDLIGDYNQTAELFIVIITLFATNYVADKCEKKKHLNASMVGFFLGLLLMLKQSTAAAALIVFMLLFVMYSILSKNKKWYFDALFVVIGFLIAVLPFMVYIISYGALNDFIVQVFVGGSSSKGGFVTIFIKSITSRLTKEVLCSVILIILLVVWLYIITTKKFNRKITAINWCALGSVVLIWLIINLFKDENLRLLFQTYYIDIILLILSVVIYYLLIRFVFKTALKKEILFLSIFISVFVISAIILYNNFAGIIEKHNIISVKNTIDIITNNLLILLIVGLICGYIYNIKHFNLKLMMLLVLFTGALASLYSGVMVGGYGCDVGIPVRTLFFSLPVILTIALGCGQGVFKLVKNSIIICVCAMLCIGVFSSKFLSAYSWWGWNEVSYSVKTETTEIKALKGIKLSRQQKNMYEQVCKLINENTDENAIVYGFPHVKIFNILTNRIGENGFVPVPFYDVSDGNYVAKDAELLAQNNPEIVIWCNIDYCLEVHESVFNDNKPLGHREIFKWFKTASERDYILIGQVGNLFVYMKDTGNPPVYTYFETPGAVNNTLINFVG